MVVRRQHRDAKSARHALTGLPSVASIAERFALVQTSSSRNKAVEQTGGSMPGLYLPDGTTGLFRFMPLIAEADMPTDGQVLGRVGNAIKGVDQSGGGGGLVAGSGSLITVITTVGVPTTIIPSPPAGTLRLVVLSDFDAMFEGRAAGIVLSNESGGDIEVDFQFGSLSLGMPGNTPLPTGSTVPSAGGGGHGAWFLIDSTEDLKCELVSGSEARVFATWLDFNAAGFGTSRVTISDDLLHEIVPAPAAGKLHEVFLFPGGAAPHLFFNPSGVQAKWLVNDGAADRLLVPSNPGSPFGGVFSSSWWHYTLREGESLKVQFDTAPSPDAVLAFAYRILDA